VSNRVSTGSRKRNEKLIVHENSSSRFLYEYVDFTYTESYETLLVIAFYIGWFACLLIYAIIGTGPGIMENIIPYAVGVVIVMLAGPCGGFILTRTIDDFLFDVLVEIELDRSKDAIRIVRCRKTQHYPRELVIPKMTVVGLQIKRLDIDNSDVRSLILRVRGDRSISLFTTRVLKDFDVVTQIFEQYLSVNAIG